MEINFCLSWEKYDCIIYFLQIFEIIFKLLKNALNLFIFYRYFLFNVKFYFFFNILMGFYVIENIIYILKDMVFYRLKDGFELVDVGDLNLIWNRYYIDMRVINYIMYIVIDIVYIGIIDFLVIQGLGKIMYCKNFLFFMKKGINVKV